MENVSSLSGLILPDVRDPPSASALAA